MTDTCLHTYCIRTHAYSHIDICVYLCIHIYTCMYTYVYKCICVLKCICIQTNIQIYIRIHINIYIYIYMYILIEGTAADRFDAVIFAYQDKVHLLQMFRRFRNRTYYNPRALLVSARTVQYYLGIIKYTCIRV
jgi:hypothetical protein